MDDHLIWIIDNWLQDNEKGKTNQPENASQNELSESFSEV